MKLNNETVNVIKNFATISGNLLLEKESKTLKTMNVSKTVLAEYTLKPDQSFPLDFGIYDLNEFISFYSEFGDADMVFDSRLVEDVEVAYVNMMTDECDMEYVSSSQKHLVVPKKSVTMPPGNFEFKLLGATISRIKSVCSKMGTQYFSVTNEGGKCRIHITSAIGGSGHKFNITIPDADIIKNTDVKFSFIFDRDNLQFIQDDFIVTLSDKLISKFQAINTSVDYFVALDKKSSYGE